jgi:predicted RNA-binding Zn ribbon-like protein
VTGEKAPKAERGDFVFLAGHPCLDFLNTRPFVRGQAVDLLPDLESFSRWLVRAGRLDTRLAADSLKRWGEGPEGARIAERARAFRETLRHTVDGLTRGRGVSTEGFAAINFILAENDGNLRLERTAGGFRTRFTARPTHPISLLGYVAEAAADLLGSKKPELIRRCGNPDCVLFFYDATRNHRRQWCAMGTCGNLMKVRAFRRRHRRPGERR